MVPIHGGPGQAVMGAIRDATPADTEVLSRIIREANHDVAVRFALTPDNCPKHPSNCTAAWIAADRGRGVRYFIFSRDDEPVGCVGLERPRADLCYLERLAVLPEMRRRGYGGALTRHALERAKAAGARQVGIGIIAAHAELRNWYGRLGFVEVETRQFAHLPFEVLFMKFDIDR